MTFPSSITFSGGQWQNVYEYILDSSSSSSSTAQYELHFLTGGLEGAQYGLLFRHESDGSTKLYANGLPGTSDDQGDPKYLTLTSGSTGSETLVIDSNDVGSSLYLKRFNDPNDAGVFVITSDMIFSGSGGGTGTESVESNQIFLDSTGALVSGQIADTEPTGSYPVTVNGVVVTGALATNPISHTTGTVTQFAIHFAYGGYGTWHLHQNYVTSALNTPIASVTINEPSSRKKVFCNFW